MAVEWWTQAQAGLIGGVCGGGIGVMGGILGSAAGMLAPAGKGRNLIFGSFYAMIGLGIFALATGAVALISGQPFHVWFWPMQIGFICTAIFAGLLPVLRIRYREAEERKLDAATMRGAIAE